MPNIKVGEKALAHLSRGLYRCPASALRELVSNAWDANAKEVRINTNYPFFYQLVISDDGDGFTKEEFKKLMEGGIGNSTKRPLKKELINNRPIIGRLGIGLLGIAQICGSFSISSTTRDGNGFKAKIKLYDLLKEKLDGDDYGVVKTEEIDVGTYDFDDDYDPKSRHNGTVIITDEVHPTFILSFQKSLEYEKFKEPPLEWSKILKILSSHNIRSLNELGDYWRLIWELSASCPIKYINENALPDSLIVAEHNKLKSYDFKIFLDGIELHKPIELIGNLGGYTTHIIESQKYKVYGKNLHFHGYIAVQEGLQLRPDELRGIIIRIKNVGIGYYDPSLLDYRINEGPRSRWLTGEIFVDEGLEDALNIDRDSFNKFHPQYRKIQDFIHEILQKNIFPRVYKQIDIRSTKRQETKTNKRNSHLRKIITDSIKIPVQISSVSLIESNHPELKVVLEENKEALHVNLSSTSGMKVKSNFKQLASSILTIFELALRETSIEKQRNLFTKLLTDLLSKW